MGVNMRNGNRECALGERSTWSKSIGTLFIGSYVICFSMCFSVLGNLHRAHFLGEGSAWGLQPCPALPSTQATQIGGMSTCRKVDALVARDEVLVETVLVGPVTKNLISGVMNHDSQSCKKP